MPIGATSPTAIAPEGQPYSEQTAQAIAKISAVNPDLGAGLANAYQTKTPYNASFLGGIWSSIWGAGKGLGAGLVNALGNIGSSIAEPFRDEPDKESDPFWVDFYQGLTGQENTRWKENLESYGIENLPGGSSMASVGGLIGDIFADPTTYIGSGALGEAKDAVAIGAKEIASFGAKGTVEAERAAKGGMLIGGKLFRDGDEFTRTLNATARPELEAAGVHPDVLDAMAGISAGNGERKLLGSVDAVANAEVEWVGQHAADTIARQRNLGALQDTVSPVTGRLWKADEIRSTFYDLSKTYNPRELTRIANEMYQGGASAQQAMTLSRKAAASLGGLRLKFGLPFGRQMAKSFEVPFLGYRWQTGALPFANRFKLFGAVGPSKSVATTMGDFFRGTSGLYRLDGAVQASLKAGDGIWTREAMQTFLDAEKGGFAGLRDYMYAREMDVPGSADAFKKLFGNKVTSSFIPLSERVGNITAHLTPGARAWRRDGYYGLRSYQMARTAKAKRKEFLQWATGLTEGWTDGARALQADARANGVNWLKGVNEDFIKFIEGTDPEAITRLPSYLQEIAPDVRKFFPKAQSKLAQLGVDVGDVTEVFARNRWDRTMGAIDGQIKTVEESLAKLDSAGPDVVESEAYANQLANLTEQRTRLMSAKGDLQKQFDSMDEYDDIYKALNPDQLLQKVSPKHYYHRRFTSEARAALVGNFQAETRSFNKAKKVTAELERKLATMDFQEAEEYMAKNYPRLRGVKRIFEDNPIIGVTKYVEDMGQAVLKNELNQGAKYLMHTLGAIDNGAATKIVDEIVDPKWMPKAYTSVKSMYGQLDSPTRVVVRDWLERVEQRLGVTLSEAPTNPTEPHQMTKAEFVDKMGTNRETEAILKEGADIPAHRQAVENAVKAGKPVPTSVLKEYPDIWQKMVTIPKNLTKDQQYGMQGLFRELGRLRAQGDGIAAIPEVAFKQVERGQSLGLWGRIDVPGLENFVMHPYMASEFNRAWHGMQSLPPGLNNLQYQWRRFVLGPWKEWATLYWPGFHARNAMGAWFNNWLGGVEHAHYKTAGQISDVMAKGEKSAFYGRTIGKMQLDGESRILRIGKAEADNEVDVIEVLQDLGITSDNSLAMADLRPYMDHLGGSLGTQRSHVITSHIPSGTVHTSEWGDVTGAEYLMRRWKAKGISTTNLIENRMRTAAFLKGLEDSGDTAAARAFTMMRHGDYDELTDVENVIKDVIPFYKWMRTNLPFQMRQLIENPGKQLAVLDMQAMLVDEDERKKLPDWMQESLLIRNPFAGKEGSQEEAAGFFMMQLPLHDLFQNGNELASGALPMVRQIVLENGLFKKSLFTGAPLEGTRLTELKVIDKIPFMPQLLTSTGLATRNKEGGLMINDRTLNILSALPLFSRSKNFLLDDPNRAPIRMGTWASILAGVQYRPVGPDELNSEEADYFYNYVQPEVDKLREQGYTLPSIEDWALAGSGGGL